jgi:DNA polymerase
MIHLDFETYSESGYYFDFKTGKMGSPPGTPKSGLSLIGAYTYAAHPSTNILCAAYGTTFDDIKLWKPNDPEMPEPLLEAVQSGKLIYAMNSFFEWCIWNLVAVRRYGWPLLALSQTRDTAAMARAWSLPGSLEKSTAILFGETVKDTQGAKIMKKLSVPQNISRSNKHFLPDLDDSKSWKLLYDYCIQDVHAEMMVHNNVPSLSSSELEVWKLDQQINARGIAIDIKTVCAAIRIVEEGKIRAGHLLAELTKNAITSVSQATAICQWINKNSGLKKRLKSLRPEIINEYLKTPALSETIRLILDIRLNYGGNSTSKLYAMLYRAQPDDRVRGAFQYCGAQRTRRWAGRGVQTQNMPRGSISLTRCDKCSSLYGANNKGVCLCGGNIKSTEWGVTSINAVIPAIQTGDYDLVESKWGNPVKLVAACLRSMLVAGPGKELISSDFSAIEAVVMACLAGENWVIETFFGDGKLYERTATKITGESEDIIIEYKKIYGKHHPQRRLGKIAALASQYQGARGAWLKFGADNFLSMSEIDKGVQAWRRANPAIVNFWNAVEEAAFNALYLPDRWWPVIGCASDIEFRKQNRALYCRLPNKEWLTYLDACVVQTRKLSSDGWRIVEIWNDAMDESQRLELEHRCREYPGLYPKISDCGSSELARTKILECCYQLVDTISYWGVGEQNRWTQLFTYGGKLAENIVQAVARFIHAEAMLRLERAGYPLVLHTHDESVAEVPIGYGSVEEFEKLMAVPPDWAKLPDGRPWPIKAAGGWRGFRYIK